jgi:hypothetical protein
MQTAYLREHIWGRCHLDRRCEGRRSLCVAHEGWRGRQMVNVPVVNPSGDTVFEVNRKVRGRLKGSFYCRRL